MIKKVGMASWLHSTIRVRNENRELASLMCKAFSFVFDRCITDKNTIRGVKNFIVNEPTECIKKAILTWLRVK